MIWKGIRVSSRRQRSAEKQREIQRQQREQIPGGEREKGQKVARVAQGVTTQEKQHKNEDSPPPHISLMKITCVSV